MFNCNQNAFALHVGVQYCTGILAWPGTIMHICNIRHANLCHRLLSPSGRYCRACIDTVPGSFFLSHATEKSLTITICLLLDKFCIFASGGCTLIFSDFGVWNNFVLNFFVYFGTLLVDKINRYNSNTITLCFSVIVTNQECAKMGLSNKVKICSQTWHLTQFILALVFFQQGSKVN